MTTFWTEEVLGGVGLKFASGRTLFRDQSPYQAVDIVETETYGRMLLLDGCVMTTEKDEFVYHEMISHVPLLAHPNPRRVLVVGGGDGGTVREVLKHPGVEEVVLVEIDGMVVDACKQYLPGIAGKLDDPRVNVQIGDGVAYMANPQGHFDVIIIDSSDPIGPGEGLFTEDFYRNAFNALMADGIMVAQTESPFLNQKLIGEIYPIFRKLFPVVAMYHGHIPTYPSGFWTWSFCSKQVPPQLRHDAMERAEAIAATCQYYNPALHDAAFVLPNFVARLIQPAPAGVAR